jgi:carboxyl-terminal processing protease
MNNMEDFSPTKQRAGKYAGVYLTIITVIVAFGAGILLGQRMYIQKNLTNADGTISPSKLANFNRATNHSDSVDFNQFWQVWDEIKSKYVKQQSVKDVDLFYGALQGMVYSLNDPYSVYFPPKAAEEFDRDLSGELSGIGAEIGIKKNQLMVIAPLPESPAQKAGLRPGDKILAIDSTSTFGMDVSVAVSKIRGPATTSVKLTILREGWKKPVDYTVHRAKINVPPVSVSMKPGHVAYIRLMQFNENTYMDFSKAIGQIKRDGATSLVLDLRNNPGGLLDSAISIASEWLPEGTVIVSQRNNANSEDKRVSSGEHALVGMKTVVLVNGGSASASEILSGALQDNKVAVIVGEKTFGKGVVQDYHYLPDGSSLKLTVAEWFTPNGNSINEKGITPDTEVKEDFENEEVGQDVMIDKAIEILKK